VTVATYAQRKTRRQGGDSLIWLDTSLFWHPSSGDALNTTVQPAARVWAIFMTVSASEKFQGLMAATIPMGSGGRWSAGFGRV
jgi:hypothetical protein